MTWLIPDGVLVFMVIGCICLILLTTNNERRLTRAKNYLYKQRCDLEWRTYLSRNTVHVNEIKDLTDAEDILWRLSWKV